MIYRETSLKDVMLIEPEPRGDERGWFARMFCREEFSQHGLVPEFVQYNMSMTRHRGTVRGLHFQRGPHVEAKLMRCPRGALHDVIVDLRGDSPTYLQYAGFDLTEENRRLLYVPPGFAHGFQAISDDCLAFYGVSASYAPAAEGGLRYDDPLIGIDWPLPVVHVSEKDASWPYLRPDMPPAFMSDTLPPLPDPPAPHPEARI